ncbi:helix-turn-helix domain-containing protein [Streptomyces sp. NPDC101158]|uniref:helix-turn-helix domain-containing protein n=1 Tax=Streptomyces sp. NPDC101158 TaxID=3366117 RepID=UPI003816C7BE
MALSNAAGTDGTPPQGLVTMDAGSVPEPDRWAWWADMVSREVMPVSIRIPRARPFQGQVEAVGMPDGQVAAFDFSPMAATRSLTQIRRHDREEYFLVLLREGQMALEQGSDVSLLHPGDMTVFSSSHPLACEFLAHADPAAGTGRTRGPGSASDSLSDPGSDTGRGAVTGPGPGSVTGPVTDSGAGVTRLTLLRLPRRILPLSSGRADGLLAVPLRANAGAAALLGPYLAGLPGAARGCGPAELGRLGSIAVDLAATAIAAQLDVQESLPTETRQAVTLAEIKAFIAQNLPDPELTPSAIAARHHLSVRTLHALFRDEPESVAASIRRRRLERCVADLADPGLRHRTIGDIAARWGLAAHDFSRSFRRAYGISPGEYRASALRAAELRDT